MEESYQICLQRAQDVARERQSKISARRGRPAKPIKPKPVHVPTPDMHLFDIAYIRYHKNFPADIMEANEAHTHAFHDLCQYSFEEAKYDSKKRKHDAVYEDDPDDAAFARILASKRAKLEALVPRAHPDHKAIDKAFVGMQTNWGIAQGLGKDDSAAKLKQVEDSLGVLQQKLKTSVVELETVVQQKVKGPGAKYEAKARRRRFKLGGIPPTGRKFVKEARQDSGKKGYAVRSRAFKARVERGKGSPLKRLALTKIDVA